MGNERNGRIYGNKYLIIKRSPSDLSPFISRSQNQVKLTFKMMEAKEILKNGEGKEPLIIEISL
jgi:hypothetical protein